MPGVKYWGNRQVSRLVSFITGQTFNDVSCGFRAYSREAMLQLNLTGEFTYTQESFLDLACKRLRITQVPVTVRYFPGRRSRVAGSIPRYAGRITAIILRTFRDHQPIRFFGTLGTVIFCLGLLPGAFAVWHYSKQGTFWPYTSLALAAAYLSTLGIIIWIAGLVADMLDRIRSNQERIIYLLKRRQFGAGAFDDATNS